MHLSYVDSVSKIRGALLKILKKGQVTESEFLKFYTNCSDETLSHQIVDGVKDFFTIYMAPLGMILIIVNQCILISKFLEESQSLNNSTLIFNSIFLVLAGLSKLTQESNFYLTISLLGTQSAILLKFWSAFRAKTIVRFINLYKLFKLDLSIAIFGLICIGILFDSFYHA